MDRPSWDTPEYRKQLAKGMLADSLRGTAWVLFISIAITAIVIGGIYALSEWLK
ncbi:MAG: hypothetical protein UU49_C0015G0012 [Candidatus Magasanikbacteria bacterium GW2011_GWC2_41_17]|uniref:Uncharacterized protein n=1 Tax=Candidatus Magasanikbacteria bacterium GW2011_GWC2_41_17 TaxID=1619048 RepID=A0A0G0YER9_9BACT|nr:MAG: hypothetical protein UU49_C0015G0012 [Candidatus Magasanikbacteria bacterium GW2011_GWC2_41_17]